MGASALRQTMPRCRRSSEGQLRIIGRAMRWSLRPRSRMPTEDSGWTARALNAYLASERHDFVGTMRSNSLFHFFRSVADAQPVDRDP